MAHRSWPRLAVLSLVTVVVAACAATPKVQVAGASGVAASIGSGNVALDTPVSIGSMILCLTGPGQATIRSVGMHAPIGDIAVEAFATRPNPYPRRLDGVGSSRGAIADLHLGGLDPAAPALVSGVCPADVTTASDAESAALVELVVQVARHSGNDAGAPALDIAYEINGQPRTGVIPMGIWLCQATCPPESGTLYRP